MKNIFKGLSAKFLVPTIIVIILAMGVMGYYSYSSYKNSKLNEIDEQANQKIEEIKTTIDERTENAEITEEAIDNYLISLTKSLAVYFSNIEEENLTEEVNNLVEEINISEIHITDSEGVIQWSTVPDFVGFDFNSSEQTKPFLEGLNNSNFVLAQEAQERGTTGEYFKYIGVSRIGKNGIVQVGVQPKALEEIFSKIDVRALANSMSYGENGYVFITRADGEIISHPDSELINTNLRQFDFGERIIEGKNGQITYDLEGEERLTHFSEYGDYIIGASLATSEYKEDLNGYRNR